MSGEVKISQGLQLPRQIKGGPPIMLSRNLANFIMEFIEAVSRASIVVNTTDGTNVLDTKFADVKFSEGGLVFTIDNMAFPGSGGGSGTGGGTTTIINGGFATYNNGTAYNVGTIVRVESTAPIGTVTPTIGVYGCVVAVPIAGTNNQVPQYPEPTSGTVYWKLIAFGVQEIGICSGTSQNAFINASNPF